jgi:hypothetical protein
MNNKYFYQDMIVLILDLKVKSILISLNKIN